MSIDTVPLHWTRHAALLCLLSLIGLSLAWELWLAPTGRGTLALKALPLLAPLPGVLRQRLYTFRWLSLLVWLYFTEGAVRAVGDRGLSASLAVLEVVLSLGLFVACLLQVRWQAAHAKKEQRP
jgi:uncharacterized membrane protein